jgi:hypothetical protein
MLVCTEKIIPGTKLLQLGYKKYNLSFVSLTCIIFEELLIKQVGFLGSIFWAVHAWGKNIQTTE